jgi:hypothetical protein
MPGPLSSYLWSRKHVGDQSPHFWYTFDEDFPFVLDCATSVSQRGKIEVYDRENKEIPPGWVIDETGIPDDTAKY